MTELFGLAPLKARKLEGRQTHQYAELAGQYISTPEDQKRSMGKWTGNHWQALRDSELQY